MELSEYSRLLPSRDYSTTEISTQNRKVMCTFSYLPVLDYGRGSDDT